MLDVLDSFQFLRPWWLLLLVAVPVILLIHRHGLRTRSDWTNVIDESLLDVLVEKGASRESKLSIASLAIAAALASLAMAGPAWKVLPKPIYERVDHLVIALDLSMSMAIRDVAPSRLEVAKRKIRDLMRSRDEGYSALVVFAGDAHVVTPLSNDREALLNLLEPLEPELMPIPGSKPEDALRLSVDLLLNVNSPNGMILLITDGIDRLTELAEFADLSYEIAILGVGTAEGGPIPTIERDGSMTHLRHGGAVVNVPVDADRLEQAANLTSGSFRMATVGDSDLRDLLRAGSRVDTTIMTEREFDVLQDAGHWLLIPLLLLAAAATRRGVLAVALLAVAPYSHSAWFDDLWQRRDQQGHAELAEGNAEAAAEMFESKEWQAVSKYRARLFEESERRFSELDSIAARFNAANALAHQGRFADAIKAYEDVLENQPDHADADFNRDLVARLLQESSQPAQSAPQGQSSPSMRGAVPQQGEDTPQGGGPSGNYSQANPDGYDPMFDEFRTNEFGLEDPSDGSPDPLAQGEPETEVADPVEAPIEAHQSLEMREAEEALQRWMRSMPNTHNLLLYNKFRLESQRRIDSGEYRPRRGAEPW